MEDESPWRWQAAAVETHRDGNDAEAGEPPRRGEDYIEDDGIERRTTSRKRPRRREAAWPNASPPAEQSAAGASRGGSLTSRLRGLVADSPETRT